MDKHVIHTGLYTELAYSILFNLFNGDTSLDIFDSSEDETLVLVDILVFREADGETVLEFSYISKKHTISNRAILNRLASMLERRNADMRTFSPNVLHVLNDWLRHGRCENEEVKRLIVGMPRDPMKAEAISTLRKEMRDMDAEFEKKVLTAKRRFETKMNRLKIEHHNRRLVVETMLEGLEKEEY